MTYQSPYHYITKIRTSPEDLTADHCLFQNLLVHNNKILLVKETQELKAKIGDQSDGWTLPYMTWSRNELKKVFKAPDQNFLTDELEAAQHLNSRDLFRAWFDQHFTISWKEGVNKSHYMNPLQQPDEKRIEGLCENVGVKVMTLTTPMVIDGDMQVKIKTFPVCRWVGKEELEAGQVVLSHRVQAGALVSYIESAAKMTS